MTVTFDAPLLIEISDEQLEAQLADQYDRWRAADSEAQQTIEIAAQERNVLDQILEEKMRRKREPRSLRLIGAPR